MKSSPEQEELYILMSLHHIESILGHSHSICIFDADAAKDYWQPQICKRISEYVSRGYSIVYVAEQNETATIQNFSRLGLAVEDYIESGALKIINKDVFYSPNVSGRVLNEQWAKLFSSLAKKRGRDNVKGFVGIGMPAESFFDSETSRQRLVDYESLVADNYDGSFEGVCCYTTKMFDKMSLSHIMMLLRAHQNTVHGGGHLKQWTNERCAEVIRNGLDQALGPTVAELILSLLLKDFGMDRDAMVSSPDRFESKLRFALGASATEIVLNKVRSEFKRAIIF